MSLTDEHESFSGASMDILFSEVVKDYRTAMNDLCEQAAGLCELQPGNRIPFSYYEHYIDGGGVVGQRSILVSIRACEIGTVFWVVVNDELPDAKTDGRRLEITEFIFSEETAGVSMNASKAVMAQHDPRWQTSQNIGPILITGESPDVHQKRQLFAFTGKNYRPAIDKSPEGPISNDNTFQFYQKHTRRARDLRTLLGICYLESPWRVPVDFIECSKV